MQTTKNIYLVGDGILDNYEYLNNKSKDLTYELTKLKYNVTNLAIDSAKVRDIRNGFSPKLKYITKNHQIEKDGSYHQLNKLIAKISDGHFMSVHNRVHNNMVVLSMGGNDIYSKIGNIIFGGDFFIGSILTDNFKKNYERILSKILNICNKIVLVSIYLPYLGKDSSYYKYSSQSETVITKWNSFVYEMAKKFNIVVLDLNKTLDTKNRSHYGTDIQRMSNISNKCMADCISYIYEYYENGKIYYCDDFENLNIKSIRL